MSPQVAVQAHFHGAPGSSDESGWARVASLVDVRPDGSWQLKRDALAAMQALLEEPRRPVARSGFYDRGWEYLI